MVPFTSATGTQPRASHETGAAPGTVDFQREIADELDNHTYDSLKIWKMFESKKSNLPNNQRIQNLSWRVNSIAAAKKRYKVMKSQSSKIRQKNLSLLNSYGSDNVNHPTNEEFDYIEHIKRMTKEEFGDYNNQDISEIAIPQQDFRTSNPIAIGGSDRDVQRQHQQHQQQQQQLKGGTKGQQQQGQDDLDYSPETANSFTSNTNSIFSSGRFDHSLSISSQVSNNNKFAQQGQQGPHRHTTAGIGDFNIESFLDLDTGKNDANFNEFDLLDLTKFDLLQQEQDHQHQQQQQQQQQQKKRKDQGNSGGNFSLSNYINSLETAAKDSEPIANMMTPIFSNQITTVNDTFTIPNNQNHNVNMKTPSASASSASTKEQMSCHSCGTTTTPLWRKSINEKNENLILCNACGLFLKLHGNLSKRNIANTSGVVSRHRRDLNLNASKVFSMPMTSNPAVSDDHMGELFGNSAAAEKPLSGLKEEDYDWLKFGL